MIETAGFVRKIEDRREAAFRLANHRLQPLGHLTAARNLSIRQRSSYGDANSLRIVPAIVPVSSVIDADGSDPPDLFAPLENAAVFPETRLPRNSRRVRELYA